MKKMSQELSRKTFVKPSVEVTENSSAVSSAVAGKTHLKEAFIMVTKRNFNPSVLVADFGSFKFEVTKEINKRYRYTIISVVNPPARPEKI